MESPNITSNVFSKQSARQCHNSQHNNYSIMWLHCTGFSQF